MDAAQPRDVTSHCWESSLVGCGFMNPLFTPAPLSQTFCCALGTLDVVAIQVCFGGPRTATGDNAKVLLIRESPRTKTTTTANIHIRRSNSSTETMVAFLPSPLTPPSGAIYDFTCHIKTEIYWVPSTSYDFRMTFRICLSDTAAAPQTRDREVSCNDNAKILSLSLSLPRKWS